MIVIVDYGTGNLNSIKNMMKRIGVESSITNKSEDILNAEKLILPGVGSFDYGMSQLNDSGLINALTEKVLIRQTPILGICLGLQLFTEYSDEGKSKGLGWVKGSAVSFDRQKLGPKGKVPHMGWANVQVCTKSKIFSDMFEETRFYFVHSYHLKIDNNAEILVTAKHGYDFTAGVEKGNIIGVQFHPEKSHKYGMKIFENFVKYY